ncbi:S10 family peptidase [Rhizosaccharibacter radicis]|uniref:Peptidase S10 n=1 Tax=Rhizosaccharibacter radicis TaxID=2782605 RepID=A0ABT1VSS5_9PROT|nr:peptidase S10 [Acetobacteraceae bacterium KSS12]
MPFRFALHPLLRGLVLPAALAISAAASTTASAAPEAEQKAPPGKVAHPEPAAAPAKLDNGKSTNALIGLLPPDSVTRHDITLDGHRIGYTATAGTLELRDEKGEPAARVFYVAYVADGQAAEKRPVSFFFNGGPGAGSAFLHLGAAGPQVLNFPAGNPTDGANATLSANPDSWLRFTDMVFIDAVGTGYSLPEHPDDAAKRFYGVKQDGSAFAEAIRIWLGRNNRTRSPKYLVGESYGGIRSIKTAYALQTEQNVPLAGVVMISPAIEMGLLDDRDNPIDDALLLPSLAASAAAASGPVSPAKLDEFYRYAVGSYLTTLANAPPQGDAADAFYGKVASVTGLPKEVVAKERGMLSVQAHDVRSRDGRLYSLYDGTLSIADPYPEGIDNGDSPDPVLFGFGLAYGNAVTGYLAEQLGFRTDLKYDLLDYGVNAAWNFKQDGDLVARSTPDLRKLLALNPSLRVFIANGAFDLACPFSTSRYVVEHLPLGRDRIRLKVYPGGHMLYTRPDSRAALAKDVAALYTRPAP